MGFEDLERDQAAEGSGVLEVELNGDATMDWNGTETRVEVERCHTLHLNIKELWRGHNYFGADLKQTVLCVM